MSRPSPLRRVLPLVLGCLALACVGSDATVSEALPMNADLSAYLDAREGELATIPAERQAELDALAAWLREAGGGGRVPELLFVCTHNSRRSQMAQLWAAAAAAREGLALRTHSAGTESTAFNPRAVAAIERAGFQVEVARPGDNPRYAVRLGADAEPILCWSKALGDAALPDGDHAAVMVCDDADRNCPFVPGATHRAPIQYVDPKVSDGTPAEAATYDERCAQIAREMLYLVRSARA